jgi:hypothetical protein
MAMAPHVSPTIDSLLADPLIQSVMRADRVDPRALKTMLTRVAANHREPRLDLEGARIRFGGQARARAEDATPLPPAPIWIGDGGGCCRC